MIALCRVFAIFHFSMCMPMRWLAGSTHHLGQQGFNWSVLPMGKAIDAFEVAMIAIKDDGSKFLDLDFMEAIFSKIYNDGPLEPLQDYMTHMFGK